MNATKTGAAGKSAGLSIFPGRYSFSASLKRKITALAKKIEQREGKHFQASLILIDDSKMKRLNRSFRKKNKTTDVLSFPLETNGKIVAGEIYVSRPQAKRQAPLFENSLEGELLRLAAHGLLHLLGYDHHTSRAKKTMFAKEEKYLSGFSAFSSRGKKC
jgi:probable rRNA maturation factor